METRGSRGVAAWCAVEEEIRQVARYTFAARQTPGVASHLLGGASHRCAHFDLFVSMITTHIIAAIWSALYRDALMLLPSNHSVEYPSSANRTNEYRSLLISFLIFILVTVIQTLVSFIVHNIFVCVARTASLPPTTDSPNIEIRSTRGCTPWIVTYSIL